MSEVMGMDEAANMALEYVASWKMVHVPVVISVRKIRLWKRLGDDDDCGYDSTKDSSAGELSAVECYNVSGRFEWAGHEEDEGYNRFKFLVECESRRVRGFVVVGGVKSFVSHHIDTQAMRE